MKRYLPFALISFIFLLFKLPNSGIRLSDTSIYFYTGHQLLQGKMLYKDIFFTNLPLLPYFSALYHLILGGRLDLYFATALIEVIATALLIYLIVCEKIKSTFSASLSAALYLFSFIILSTSDHQTGVFLASFFAVLSYFFFGKKRLILSGISIAVCILIKAYFLPVLLAYISFFLFKRTKKIYSFLLGFVTTTLLILLPFLLFTNGAFIRDVFEYSLTRSQGIEKTNILWFFITHDFMFVILFIFNLLLIKKLPFFAMLSFFGIIFFLLYSDVYYLYLNFLIPFLCISFAFFYQSVTKYFRLQKLIIPTISLLLLGYSLFIYTHSFADMQRVKQIDELAAIIRQTNPPVLYGVNDITPALAYLSKKPLLANIIDTNANLFRKGILNSKRLTNDAIKQKAMIITHGISYPEFNIQQDNIDEIIDNRQLLASCRMIKSIPVKSEGMTNRVNLFICS